MPSTNSPSKRSERSENGSPQPRRRIGFDARRALIIQAAWEVFAEVGYAGAAMEAIAKRAGITKATLYDHFASKRDLHIWLLERQREELFRIGAAAMAEEGTFEERVERTFDAFFRYVEANPYAWRMLFRETTGDAEVAAEHRRIHAEAAAAIAGLLFGDLETASPFATTGSHPELSHAAGELIRGSLHGISLWWMEHRETPREEIVALCMAVYWPGIALLRGDHSGRITRQA